MKLRKGAFLLAAICASASAISQSQAPSLNVRVVGTASFQGRNTALIEDLNIRSQSFYRPGDNIYGYIITAINADSVQLEKDGSKSTLKVVTIPPPPIPAVTPEALDASQVANLYLPGTGWGDETTPNFYTGQWKETTQWDVFTPRESGKTPSMAGEEGPEATVLNRVATAVGRFMIPVAYKRLSSGFGYRIHPISGNRKLHKGLDFSANRGTKIMAADNGVVTFSGWKGGYGYCVIVDHKNGYKTLYGHCSKLMADTGDNVRRGDLIALVGSTGASTGNHLHFEVQRGGTPIDPKQFFPKIK